MRRIGVPAASANDDAHGNFIPFLVVGLFWWKRKELLASPFNIWWPGLLILVAGMVLHILGYVLQQPRISIVALFTGIYGLMGLAWGREWLRKSFFPFFLFVFSIPLGDQAKFITVPVAIAGELVGGGGGAYCGHWRDARWGRNCSIHRALTNMKLPRRAAASGVSSRFFCWPRFTVSSRFARRGNGFFSWRWRFRSPFWEIWRGCFSSSLRRNSAGRSGATTFTKAAIFSLVPYLPAIIGLLVVGRLMEKRWGSDESAEQGHP